MENGADYSLWGLWCCEWFWKQWSLISMATVDDDKNDNDDEQQQVNHQ